MGCSIRCSRGLKICCGVTSILLITLLVVLVVLFLTIFKLKDPIIIVHPAKLERFVLVFFPGLELNVSLGIDVTVQNRNYGSFSYQNSTADLKYRGNFVSEAPIHEGTIPARGEQNISTTLDISAESLTKHQSFEDDFAKGIINFTSASTLQGEVRILNHFKRKATSLSTCDISVFIQTRSANSTCNSKIKL